MIPVGSSAMKNLQHPTYRILLVLALLATAATAFAEGEEAMIAVGEPFVDFALEAHDGTTVESAALAGRPYLVFFYPKASTPG